MSTFRRTVIIVILVWASGVGFAQAPPQVANDRPAFEVASVKINKSADRRSSMDLQAPDRLTMSNQMLVSLVSLAYRVPSFKISGWPSWSTSERFDILAKTEGKTTTDQKMLMLRTLLEDRFKLKVRNETTEGPIYALVVARGDGRLGPDIRPSSADNAAVCEAIRRGEIQPPASPALTERPLCGATGGPALFRAGGMEMSQFAITLGAMMQQTVIDRTGLTGRFDFDLRAIMRGFGPSTRPGGTEVPSIFTAVQEQLGLKLESERGPVEVLVIDSVELPTPD